MRLPSTEPQRSNSVCMSASAWQGCSSLLSALTTWSFGVISVIALNRSCPNVRITTASTQRSRFRATSLIGSRSACITSAGISTTSPPSSRAPIVNVTRVRSDGFSNSMPTCLPLSTLEVGAFMPNARSRFKSAADSSSFAIRSGFRSRIDRKFCKIVHKRKRNSLFSFSPVMFCTRR